MIQRKTSQNKHSHRQYVSIAVVNSKGGCGKSTISTNLAAYFTTNGLATTIFDYDPQGSSLKWLKARPSHFPTIYGISKHSKDRKSAFSRSWLIEVPYNTQRLIIDTPAALDGFFLDDIIVRSQILIIPVLPSSHDIRATAEFISQLYINTQYRRCNPPTCVIANRVTKDTLAFGKLQRFLFQLKIPFISTFSDNRYYLQAAEKGMGICELATRLNDAELFEWEQLLSWINDSVGRISNRNMADTMNSNQSTSSSDAINTINQKTDTNNNPKNSDNSYAKGYLFSKYRRS